MKIILSILLLTFLFPQETVEPVLLEDETCEGTCFSDEEVQNIELHITELENKDSLNVQIINNLNSQILDYEKLNLNNDTVIENYKKQIALKDMMIKEIKPKWYHNRYIWFGLGIAFTSGSVMLAGQIN
jgi:hypothetical protein